MAKKKTQASVTHFAKVTLAFIFLAGCTPLETPRTASPILPPPIVQITHAVTETAVPTDTLLTPTPPGRIPIPKSDIEKLADELYGERVIEQITIPALDVESKVIPVGWRIQFSDEFQSGEFEWDSPGADVGWVITSALPDETGNVVLYGHNNLYGRIFQRLADLVEGDKIYLQTGSQRWEYEVSYILILPVVGASAKQIRGYQKYLQPTEDERITLISCWPPISNTHRVVVIAHRVSNP